MRQSIKYLLFFIGIPILYFIIFQYFRPSKQLGFGFSLNSPSTYMYEALRPCVLSIFTIIGILSKFIYDNVKKSAKEAKFSMRTILNETLNSRNTWIAIILCPVVIVGFYNAIDSIDSIALVALFSYQNGFFFNTIMSGLSET